MPATKPYPNKKHNSLLSIIIRTGVVLLVLSLLFLLTCIGFYFSVYNGAFGALPTKDELKAIRNPLASEVYSEDSRLLGKYYIQNRTNVDFRDISANILQALVATEDARFFKHEGVDTRSMFRVLFKTILMGDDSSGGGSTITQQLIKNLFPRQDYGILSMLVNKTKEAIIARDLEEVYSKEDIITLYLNTVSFGEQAYGIETATKRFFQTTPDNVTREQAATLIGMLKAPTSYSPRLHPERSLERRNVVLEQMEKYGYLSSADAMKSKAKPMGLKYRRESHSDGQAPHFREKLRMELKPILENIYKRTGKKYSLYTDGLKIHTSINYDMQLYGEQAVAVHMQDLQDKFEDHWSEGDPWGTDKDAIERGIRQSERYRVMTKAKKSKREMDRAFREKIEMRVFAYNGEIDAEGKNTYEIDTLLSPRDSVRYYLRHLNTGFMAMEPKSGYVRAWVGGINHKHFQYDHVTSTRQVGSTFKPIVYAAAMQHGVEPCTYYPNSKITYYQFQRWSPKNADGKYGGSYSMKGALTNSVNTVSVQVVLEAGVSRTIKVARDMGIVSDLPKSPTIALGTPDISLKEMVGAYGTFVNKGYGTTPIYLLKITDKNGKVIYEDRSHERKYKPKVLEKYVADAMVDMLENVVDEGTGRRLRFRYKFENEIGGKTGTTQSQSDGWFMGITPKLVAGAWVGGAERQIRFRDISLGQGANMALPIFAEFMKRVYEDPQFRDISQATFDEPDELLAEELEYCRDWISTRVARRPIYVEPVEKDEDEELEEEDKEKELVPIVPPPAATTVITKAVETNTGVSATSKPVVNPIKSRPKPEPSTKKTEKKPAPKPEKKDKPVVNPIKKRPKPSKPIPKIPPSKSKAEPSSDPKPAPPKPKADAPKTEKPKADPPVVRPKPPKPKPSPAPGPAPYIPSKPKPTKVKSKPRPQPSGNGNDQEPLQPEEKKRKRGIKLFKKKKKKE